MNRLLALAVLLVPAAASSQGVPAEARRGAAADAFAGAPAALRAALEPASPEPVLQPALKPVPLPPARVSAAPLAAVDLAAVLDRNLHVTNYRFGARALDLGVATDAGFKSFFLSFSDPAGTTLAPLGDLNRLRGDGVDARIDASTVYNFRVSISIFSPVRGSTLHMNPARGTAGPAHDLKTGALLDAARARATVLNARGGEYWMFYGRDALPSGGFAPTRSFLFVHMDGLSSKAWPLAEAALAPGVPALVDLGGTRLALLKRADGTLMVSAAD
ncbi:MAG: hypothetical protein HY079_12185 [Elusimicrobia bacterium]|nr:hypothetical protein [Elusimicrobiota bacterium]